MVFLTTVREKLKKHGIQILMSESSTIDDCLSKFKFAEICANNGLPVPSVYTCLEDIEYPCVAKLNTSQASKGVFIIKTHESLKRLLNKYNFSELIFQEYIKAQEYTLDSFYGRNGELICSVPRKRLKVVDGESIISETEHVPELINLAEQLSSVFKFWGHITIQVFFDGSRANLIEINPRFGGASNLGFNAGLKSLEWMLCLINKNYEQIQVGEIKYNLKMLRYSQDFFYET
jgi:carbamoyl-phosphate synthase large subunit